MGFNSPELPQTCLVLSSPDNGQVNNTSGSSPGSVATYSCNTGYRLNSTNERRCDNGQWTGVEPTCMGG